MEEVNSLFKIVIVCMFIMAILSMTLLNSYGKMDKLKAELSALEEDLDKCLI